MWLVATLRDSPGVKDFHHCRKLYWTSLVQYTVHLLSLVGQNSGVIPLHISLYVQRNTLTTVLAIAQKLSLRKGIFKVDIHKTEHVGMGLGEDVGYISG